MKVPAWMKGSCIRVIVKCLCVPGQTFLGGSSPTSRKSRFGYLSGGDCSPWPNCLSHGHEWRAREPPVQPKLTMAPSLSSANAGKYTGLCVGGARKDTAHCRSLRILDKSANLGFYFSRTFCCLPFTLHRSSLKPAITTARKSNPNKF